MKSGFTTCRHCGKKIGIITRGIYRKEVVDAEAVLVVADPDGEAFVRVDGSKVLAREVSYESTNPEIEAAYRPHRKTCGVRT